MFSEIIFSSVLFTVALSVEQPATSYSKFNENHNTIQHIQSQPIQQKFVYQPTVYKAAPIQQAAPSYQSIGGYSSGSLQGYQGLGAYTAGSLQAVVPSYQGLGSLQSSRVPASSLSGLSFGQNLAPASYAVPVKIASPVYTKAEEYKEEDYGPAQYEFAYGVEDHHTGDIHSQKESRNGDFTQGEYSLREADGTIRTVKYTVDKHSGFNAVVERTGQPQIKAAPQYAHY